MSGIVAKSSIIRIIWRGGHDDESSEKCCTIVFVVSKLSPAKLLNLTLFFPLRRPHCLVIVFAPLFCFDMPRPKLNSLLKAFDTYMCSHVAYSSVRINDRARSVLISRVFVYGRVRAIARYRGNQLRIFYSGKFLRPSSSQRV